MKFSHCLCDHLRFQVLRGSYLRDETIISLSLARSWDKNDLRTRRRELNSSTLVFCVKLDRKGAWDSYDQFNQWFNYLFDCSVELFGKIMNWSIKPVSWIGLRWNHYYKCIHIGSSLDYSCHSNTATRLRIPVEKSHYGTESFIGSGNSIMLRNRPRFHTSIDETFIRCFQGPWEIDHVKENVEKRFIWFCFECELFSAWLFSWTSLAWKNECWKFAKPCHRFTNFQLKLIN